jgi:integrase
MGRHRAAGNERLGEYVQKRTGGMLELRFPIPTDVSAAFAHSDGRAREYVIKSLGTMDFRAGNARADVLRSVLRSQIADVRSAKGSPKLGDFLRTLYDQEMALFRQGVDADESARKAAMFGAPKASAGRNGEMTAFNRRWQGEALLSTSTDEKRATAGWAADAYFRDWTGQEPLDSPEYREVLDQCATTLVDALIAQSDLEAGRPEPVPTSAALAPQPKQSTDGNTATSERGKQRISAYFTNVYVPALLGSISMKGERTLSGKQLAVRLFSELVGDKPVFLITQSDIWQFCEELEKLPNARDLKGDERGLNARELIKAASAGRITVTPIHAKTVNKHISGIVTLLAHAEKRRDIAKGCGKGVRADIDYEADTGRSFTTDELNRIFRLPIFAGCREGEIEAGLFKAGDVQVRDDRFWMPLLLLFTGARSSEIAGLEVADVDPDHEVPHLLIRVNSVRRLKNKHSKRMVPVHPRLIDMGFLDFAREQIASGGVQFFPLAVQEFYNEKVTGTRQKKSLSSCSIMRQFNRTLLEHADAQQNDGSVKCFRNTFEQESLGQIESDDARLRLTGRDPKTTATIYTKNIPDDPIKRSDHLVKLLADISKITYRGVDLSHLVKAS